MAKKFKDLPEECWEMIFNRLDHHSYFEPLSLVCQQFLSLTNRLRTRLNLIHPTILIHGTISKLLQRFRYLKAIDLSNCRGEIDDIILEIACSSLLNLEFIDFSNQKSVPIKGLIELGLSMKSLRVLKCANLCVLRNSDLVAIADSLPWLEELDISYPSNNFDWIREIDVWTSGEVGVADSGIEALSANLKNLHKLNISGNHFITDRSLVALSLNCLLLRELAVLDCSFITQNGIHFVLRNSPNLSSISVNGIHIPLTSSPFEDLLSCPRALRTLDFYDMVISDVFLYSIAKASIPLKRLSLSCCTNFTFSGISSLLCTYQSLEYLALVKVDFLTDQYMSDLSRYLCNLVTIKLSSCYKLTNLTFFTIARTCSLLKEIEMKRTKLGKEDLFIDFTKNPRIKCLNLARNPYLSDGCLKKFASICPNLEILDLSSCSDITEVGIAEIFKSCCDVRHVQINFCAGVKNIGTGSELPKLEILCAPRSGIANEGLAAIGKRCHRLLKLDLEGCVGVTTRVVEEVVSACETLREINLKGCHNVNVGIVDWMVFSRPSLRKIIPPSYSSFTKNQKNFFLRHGSLVWDG
ncbi:unnamed protein product [Ilex paraguariensis]|uniref:F-box domain-containing protein n=1 Tax=Ilex paraguariensis TaxID=185542 RepID=A0ABC8TK19_9AQUA